MLMLYWIELAQRTKVSELYFVKDFKPLLFTLMVVPVALMMPVRIWYDITLSLIAQYAFSGIFSVLLFIVLGVISTVGLKMIRMVRGIWKTTNQSHFKTYLKKLTIAILASVMFISNGALLLIPYAFYGNKPWSFLCFQGAFRFLEGLCITCFLIAIHKQKSEEQNDSSSNLKTVELTELRVSSESTPSEIRSSSGSVGLRFSGETVASNPDTNPPQSLGDVPETFKRSDLSTDGNESVQLADLPMTKV